jgi:uncharacterized protein YjiS (DUF1127 family)
MTTRQSQTLGLSGSTDASRPEKDSSTQTAAPHVLSLWMARSAQRRELRELVREKRLLNDVGLSREQALREAVKPFWRP